MTAEEIVRRHMARVRADLDAADATEAERELVVQWVTLALAERELDRAAAAFFEASDRLTFARADLDRRVDALVAALRDRARERATVAPSLAPDDGIDW